MYTLTHIDTCRSDYFGGHHLPVVQVLVDENTTYLDIKLALIFSIDLIEDINIDTHNYIKAVHELFRNFSSLNYVPDCLYEVGSMEDQEDQEEWNLYMYFGIEEVEDEN